MATKINFTKAVLDALPVPPTGRVYYFDKSTTGLCVSVMASGTKTFFLYKRIGSKPVRYKIGRYPDVPPHNARQEAMKLLAKIATGENPQEERRKARIDSANAKSLNEVWEHYRDKHLAKHCAANSVRNHGYFIAAVPFTSKKLDDISTDEVKQLHRSLSERAPTMANSTVAFLRTLYLYATDELAYTGRNPVTIRKVKRGDRRRMGGIVLNPKKSRTRFIQADELPRFFEALKDEEDEDFRDLMLLLLFTGARRGNVQEMKWADVSLERAVWVIPITKNGDPVVIALSSWAMEVLKQRAAKRVAGGQFVFPSARAKSGHIEEPKKQWWELIKRAKLENLHMHDLRRTLATYQRTTGATLEMIGAALGHRSRSATEIYARIDIAPVRDSVTTATRALVDAGKYQLAKPETVEAAGGS